MMNRRWRLPWVGRLFMMVAIATGFSPALLSILLPAEAVQSAGRVIGVVDFYAPTPVPWIGSFIPQRFASNDLTTMLARAGEGVFEVVPRAAMLEAERAVNWQDDDVLRFARLTELGRRVRAERLIVGWLSLVARGRDSIPGSGGGPMSLFARVAAKVPGSGDGPTPLFARVVAQQIPGGGGGPLSLFVGVDVKVFDVNQGRIVAQTHGELTTIRGMGQADVEQSLHRALELTVERIVSALTAPAK